ncbi:hypothetical protein GGR51DRAFT_562472 [Nemania sp. FL0031]|nr:hypothetical protein GGR51DRAFT_562472 [Nemania sp. FL0031]
MAPIIKDRTITGLLGINNPRMVVDKTKAGPTKNSKYVQISQTHIRPMQGFTQANIEAMYQDILSKRIKLTQKKQQDILYISSKDYTYNCDSEKCIDRILLDWFPAVLQPCMVHSSAVLHRRFGLAPKNLEIKHEPKLYRGPGGYPLLPDWVFVDINELNRDPRKDTAGLAYVVGDDKLSVGFDPRSLERLPIPRDNDREKKKKKNQEEGSDDIIPYLQQIGTYAWLGQTRYAFIITDKTATFFRFFLVHRGEEAEDTTLGVEYSWVDLTTEGTNELTMNRGIYALAMMAQNEQYHKIVEEKELDDLRAWYWGDVGGERLYFHPISEILTTKSPGMGYFPTNIFLAKIEIQSRFTKRRRELASEVDDDIEELSETDTESISSALSGIEPRDHVIDGRVEKQTEPVKLNKKLQEVLKRLSREEILFNLHAWDRASRRQQEGGG